jgi:hypothetical protein
LLCALRISLRLFSILVSFFSDNCSFLITLISSFLFRLVSSIDSLHASYSYSLLSTQSSFFLFLISTNHISSMTFESRSDHFTAPIRADEILCQIKIPIHYQRF